MKTFTRISIAITTVVGLAAVATVAGAQPAQPAPAKPAAPAPTPTATVDKKKAPEPAKPAPTPDKPAPAPAMEMPKPPAEIAGAFKAMSGTWKCVGTAMDPGAGEVPTKGTMKHKLDLDSWWIVSSFTESKKGGYKYTSMSSFDGKKWSRTMFDNMGGRETAESTGMVDNKMTWDGSSTSMMGTMKSRHFEEVKGPREAHIWGEYSQDGKAWMKAYDVTCKK